MIAILDRKDREVLLGTVDCGGTWSCRAALDGVPAAHSDGVKVLCGELVQRTSTKRTIGRVAPTLCSSIDLRIRSRLTADLLTLRLRFCYFKDPLLKPFWNH